MDGQPLQSSADSIRTSKTPIEKVDFHFNDILRVYPEQISLVITSFQDWARQFKWQKNKKNIFGHLKMSSRLDKKGMFAVNVAEKEFLKKYIY
jgi:hypothetical protein